MSKPLLIPGLLAALLVCAAATTQPATRPDDTMYATIDRVRIILSPNWNLNAGGKGVFISQPPALDRDPTGQFQAVLACNHGTLNKLPPDMGTLGVALQTSFARQQAGYTILEKPVAITLNGLKGVKFGGTFKHGTALVRDRQYVLLTGAGTEIYQLTFTSLNSTWAGYQPIVEKAMNSFRLTAPSNPATQQAPSATNAARPH